MIMIVHDAAVQCAIGRFNWMDQIWWHCGCVRNLFCVFEACVAMINMMQIIGVNRYIISLSFMCEKVRFELAKLVAKWRPFHFEDSQMPPAEGEEHESVD